MMLQIELFGDILGKISCIDSIIYVELNGRKKEIFRQFYRGAPNIPNC